MDICYTHCVRYGVNNLTEPNLTPNPNRTLNRT